MQKLYMYIYTLYIYGYIHIYMCQAAGNVALTKLDLEDKLEAAWEEYTVCVLILQCMWECVWECVLQCVLQCVLV